MFFQLHIYTTEHTLMTPKNHFVFNKNVQYFVETFISQKRDMVFAFIYILYCI